jgi:DNA-binding CsgD family transcriptional regulator
MRSCKKLSSEVIRECVLRVTAFWLQSRDWKSFIDYEADLNNVIADKPITLLCTYPLSVSKASDLLDVARAHQVALSKRQNAWEVIKAWGPARATATANEKHADVLEAAERISLLSQRMRQVLDALADGRLSKELAQPLGLSVRTVELHRARMGQMVPHSMTGAYSDRGSYEFLR